MVIMSVSRLGSSIMYVNYGHPVDEPPGTNSSGPEATVLLDDCDDHGLEKLCREVGNSLVRQCQVEELAGDVARAVRTWLVGDRVGEGAN